jgi:hypothetical protein
MMWRANIRLAVIAVFIAIALRMLTMAIDDHGCRIKALEQSQTQKEPGCR